MLPHIWWQNLTFLQQSLETSQGSCHCWGWVTPVSPWTTSAPAPSGLPRIPPCWGQHHTSSPSSGGVCHELTDRAMLSDCASSLPHSDLCLSKGRWGASFDYFHLLSLRSEWCYCYQWLSLSFQFHFTICVPGPTATHHYTTLLVPF